MLEIELKFQIAPSRHNAIAKALEHKSAENIQLQAKYYDTADRRLAAHGIALRQRRENECWVQTLKAAGQSHLHRFEHNIDLGQDTPESLELEHYLNDAEAAQVLTPALGNLNDTTELCLQFKTDIQRTARLIEFEDAVIELSLDIGEIRAAGRVQPVYELEMELKQGELSSLLKFSFEWVKKYQLWLDVRSKAEFGNLLMRDCAVSPATHAKEFQFNKKDSADANLRQLVANHMQHLLPNIAAIAALVAEPEHIQQAQIALHHLQLSLSLFKDWSSAVSAKWSQQLNAFKEHFENLEHFEHMQATLAALLQNPKTAQSLSQDILYAQEKLNNLVKSTQNVQHYIELLMFSAAGAEVVQKQDLKQYAQNTLQQQYKTLQDSLSQVDITDLDSVKQLALHLNELKFSFPLLTHIYDVKNLQKYSKALNDAQHAAQQYQVLAASASYLQETELEASDWFALGWLTAKLEQHAEVLMETTEQFLVSRKFIK